MPARTLSTTTEQLQSIDLDNIRNLTATSPASLPSSTESEHGSGPARAEPAIGARRTSAPAAKSRRTPNLACLSCRPRKIKCERLRGSCERCRTLKIPCQLPDRDERRVRHSKDYIQDLESQIAELKNALASSQALPLSSQLSEPPTPPQDTTSNEAAANNTQLAPMHMTQRAASVVSMSDSGSPDGLLDRLCGTRGRLNSNDNGQVRYFGPTSSLHLTESVTSIFGYCSPTTKNGIDFEKGIPWKMQQALLDVYWKHQRKLPLSFPL